MRVLAWFGSLLVLGCSVSVPGPPAPPEHAQEPAAADWPGDDLPPDLRTRKTGSDWPGFLGPSGNSVSPEKGILTPWPQQGPPLVWQTRIAGGYCMPSISRGRLFLF